MADTGTGGLGCLVMAAGSASRFGSNKLTAVIGGRSLIARALDAIPQDLFSCVTVVSGYESVLALARTRGFSAVVNDRPAEGVSRTIRLGTAQMLHCSGILYMVADQPFLQQETVRRIAARWRAEPGCIAAAAADGRRGNPCLFPARFFPELLALTGDRGGSAVIRAHPEALRLVETDARELADCDTPQAFGQLEDRFSGSS